MKFPAAGALCASFFLPLFLLRAQTPAPASEVGNAPKASPVAPPKPAAVERPASTLREMVDTLNAAEIEQVITLLKENYLQPAALSDLATKRATVQGLLERIAPGAALRQVPAADALVAGPFRAEILDAGIGYVRLGSATAENVTQLDATLEKFRGDTMRALVLDLRATPPGSDFQQTAEVCKRFCPKGKVLFSVKKPSAKQEQILTSNTDPKFQGLLVALVDGDTRGDAEVIAAVLRAQAKAMVIGQQTRGEAVEYSDLPLSGGMLLRVAVAETALPENIQVFPGGVKPDLLVEVPQEITDAVLRQELEKGVSEFVYEIERPRMNEAALVAGQNPEIDAAQAAQKAKGEKAKPPLRDVALQRAVDFITTVALYEKKPAEK